MHSRTKLDLDGALPDIQERAELAAQAAIRFREMQTVHGLPAQDFLLAKDDVRDRLESLGIQLDAYLASEYGIVPQPDQEHVRENGKDPLQRWQTSHRPFHWFVEFNEIMENGGFGVVIGNPPYVQWRKVEDYGVIGYETSKCPDMFAVFIERSTSLIEPQGRFGMILPISFQFSKDFAEARALMRSNMHTIWASTFSRNPAALFDAGLGVRSTICLGRISRSGGHSRILTTRLNRWVEEFRAVLFDQLEYSEISSYLSKHSWPRMGNSRIESLFSELVSRGHRLGGDARRRGRKKIRFKNTALYYISAFIEDPPSYDEFGSPIAHTKVGQLYFENNDMQEIALGIALGKIALVWWASTGDDFDVTASGLASTPVGSESLTARARSDIVDLSRQIREALGHNVIYTRYAGKWMGNYDVKNVRHLTDTADRIVLESLGLAEYWDDLELEYLRFLKMTGERPGTTRDLPVFW